MASRARDLEPGAAAFADLLARARCGDGGAWEQLYRWLAPTVAGYLRVQGAQAPADLTSEVFLALVSKVKTFTGGPAQFRAFVFVLAHRRLQDERRRESRRARSVIDEAFDVVRHGSPTGDVADHVLDRLAGERVLTLCAPLSPDQRDVVMLRVVADLSLEQVAGVVGKTTGAVKALQKRAFDQIRRNISQEAVSR